MTQNNVRKAPITYASEEKKRKLIYGFTLFGTQLVIILAERYYNHRIYLEAITLSISSVIIVPDSYNSSKSSASP